MRNVTGKLMFLFGMFVVIPIMSIIGDLAALVGKEDEYWQLLERTLLE